jgi:hypothetical protein
MKYTPERPCYKTEMIIDEIKPRNLINDFLKVWTPPSPPQTPPKQKKCFGHKRLPKADLQ